MDLRVVLVCGTAGGEAADGHVHYCDREKGHRGKHECSISPGAGARACGHRW